MPAVARKGDTSAKGRIATTGSGNVSINGQPAVRVGDTWEGSKPAIVSQAAGSATVFVNGQPLARVGDVLSDGDTVATGSGNVSAG